MFGVASRELAQMVADDYEPDMILSIARGGLLIGGALGYALSVKNVYTMNVEFYTGVDERLEVPRILPPAPDFVDVSHARILIADDVADTGHTLRSVQDFCAGKVAEVRTACLYEKSHSVVKCDYVWKRTDQWINFPWSDKEPVAKRDWNVRDARTSASEKFLHGRALGDRGNCSRDSGAQGSRCRREAGCVSERITRCDAAAESSAERVARAGGVDRSHLERRDGSDAVCRVNGSAARAQGAHDGPYAQCQQAVDSTDEFDLVLVGNHDVAQSEQRLRDLLRRCRVQHRHAASRSTQPERCLDRSNGHLELREDHPCRRNLVGQYCLICTGHDDDRVLTLGRHEDECTTSGKAHTREV